MTMQFVVAREPGVASLPGAGGAERSTRHVHGHGRRAARGGGRIARGDTDARGRSSRLDASAWTKREVWSRPALTGAARVAAADRPQLALAGNAGHWHPAGRRAHARAGQHPQRDHRTARADGIRADRPGTGPARERARAEARRLAANDEIERMRASRPDEDPEATHASTRRRSGDATARAAAPGCCRGWSVAHAVEQLPALWSGSRQTLTERLAGTVVVVTHR